MKGNKRKLKLLNFFNKRNNKNRKKRSVKKRRIFASSVLAGNLLFGNLKTDYLKTQNYSNATPLAHEKVISDQEFNSLDDSHNSGKIIVRTGNGRILEFQQEVSDASSNKILSEHNLNEPDEVILIKDDGILPGAEGYTPNSNPRKRHPFGRPRMRGSKPIEVFPPQNIQGLGNIPEEPKVRSFREVDTGLNAGRGNPGDQCPAPKFNMEKEYTIFLRLPYSKQNQGI
jgi:hypothetical protein